MPSFWMSYVRVESLRHSVDLAVSLGAKCEIEPTAFGAQSHFALIRDPFGAGFTLYEGEDLNGRDKQGRHGRMSWNELHVPSIDLVEPFYRGLFGWAIAPDPSFTYRHAIKSPAGATIASILEIDEQTKGPKNYWAVFFAVRNVSAMLKAVTDSGGSVLMMQPIDDMQFAMATDDQGAMFCLSEIDRESLV